jgi:three-Cys-motif partner protein
MTPDEWLKKYVTILTDLGDKTSKSEATISYGPHTLLKIIAVYYYAEMFAKIAKGEKARSRGYDAAVYLDLFAGPGLVAVDGIGDFVAGSPIAATSTKYKFDYSIFVEIDEDRAEALRKRLSQYLTQDRFEVLTGDSNAIVPEIISKIKSKCKKPIVFAFIDPQGMEAKWSTAKQLSAGFKSLDFMINVTSGAARVAGRIQSGKVGDRPIFEDFFGQNAEEILTKINNGVRVEAIFEDGVKDVLGRPQGETISICDSGNRVMYHLLCYTRESWTGSPWAQGFRELKKQIELADGVSVRRMLDVVRKRQSPL